MSPMTDQLPPGAREYHPDSIGKISSSSCKIAHLGYSFRGRMPPGLTALTKLENLMSCL